MRITVMGFGRDADGLRPDSRGDRMPTEKTTIQVTPQTRDRLFKLKFRRTYDQFLNELCDMFEEQSPER